MPFEYLLHAAWRWIAGTGLNITILIVVALLVPRAGRLANRLLERRVARQGDEDEGKSTLALGGVGVYVVQIIVYFVIIVAILQQLGFSLAGAAIPATVVSAAIGFGAQSIIADFLSGFFIISEKQYGVGDWVAFTGNGIDIEGTVIQFTMRSTQIRMIDQSTVNIPNSTARVAINRSNYWSRAVVVMPVPLLGSTSSDEALERSEAATRRALARPDIASEILGELDVQPAVAVTPPTTVGMPWTVDMRFMIQVKAGSQWLVERAIRMSILNEFWDEYGSATTVSGELIEAVHTPKHPTGLLANHNYIDTEEFPAVAASETAPVPLVDEKSSSTDSDQPDVPEAFDEGDGEDPAAKDHAKETPADDDELTAAEVITLGGRMRKSTAGLIVLLAILLVLRGLTFSTTVDDQRFAGLLAPPPQLAVLEETATSETPTTEATQLSSSSEPALTTEVVPSTEPEATSAQESAVQSTPQVEASPSAVPAPGAVTGSDGVVVDTQTPGAPAAPTDAGAVAPEAVDTATAPTAAKTETAIR